MNLKVRFEESKQTFIPQFGEVHNISDGGYERGYAAGYEDGAESVPDFLELAITNSLTEYSNDSVTTLRSYAFRECSKLTRISLPNLKSTGTHVFMGCSLLESIDFPLLDSVGANAFQNCTRLTLINVQKITTVSAYMFHSCSNLTKIHLPLLTTLGAYGFTGCTSLAALVLSGKSTCSLSSINALQNTPIEGGTGYIYVPDELVDSYKAATNWSTYASQIRAIEDYPEITGGFEGGE